MSVLFYSPGHGNRCENLQRRIGTVVADDELEVYRTTMALANRLRTPRYNLRVGVLHTPCQRSFSDVFSLRDLLNGIRIILILPDQEHDTISRAYKLEPRFLSYVDDDPVFVTAVLDKMLSNHHTGEYPE